MRTISGEVSRSHSSFRKRAVKELRRSHRRDEGQNGHRNGIRQNVPTGVKRGHSGREQHQRKPKHKGQQDETVTQYFKEIEPESGL